MTDSDAVVMTAAALQALQVEIERLEGQGRNEIAERIRTAREWGDLKENAEYHDAKKSQAMLETRILQLREASLHAEVREEQEGNEIAGLGSRVSVADATSGRESEYSLVSATEADAASEHYQERFRTLFKEAGEGVTKVGESIGDTLADATGKAGDAAERFTDWLRGGRGGAAGNGDGRRPADLVRPRQPNRKRDCVRSGRHGSAPA